jgi:AcrR family transcriptional regulator
VPSGQEEAVTATARRGYHHGNLRADLLAAGLELTRAGGPSALVLRDVTRKVGVSPNAAYRHFVDRESLRAAVVVEIQRAMVERMATPAHSPGGHDGGHDGARASEEAVRTLRAVGLGYVRFALAEPGWFETALGPGSWAPIVGPAPSAGGPVRAPAAQHLRDLPAPLARLVAALDGLVAAGLLSPDRRAGAEWPCWSAVHGFALLAIGGPLRGQPPDVVRSAAERTVDAIIAGVLG